MADEKKPQYSNENAELLKDVFLGSVSGRRALKLLLTRLGYFGDVNTEETRITRNFAAGLVRTLSPADTDIVASALIDSLSANRSVKEGDNK